MTPVVRDPGVANLVSDRCCLIGPWPVDRNRLGDVPQELYHLPDRVKQLRG